MAPTHSGATAPVRAQGPARYSVLEHGLRRNVCRAQAQGCGLGRGLPRAGRGSSRQAGAGRHDRVRVGDWMGSSGLPVGGAEGGGQAVIF